jgi:hypothetical protein
MLPAEVEALELKEEFARRLGEQQRTIDILKVRRHSNLAVQPRHCLPCHIASIQTRKLSFSCNQPRPLLYAVPMVRSFNRQHY